MSNKSKGMRKEFVVAKYRLFMRIRRADYATPLYPQKLALNSPTSGGRSVGVVRSRTKATEYVSMYVCMYVCMYACMLRHLSALSEESHGEFSQNR
jgi:hypothetical protein